MNTVTPSIHVPARIPENTMLLFVYGTLKKGGMYHRNYLEHAEFVNRTSIEGFTLYTSNGCWPMAVPAEGEHINGEWWLVSEQDFERVAHMELSAGYDLCTIDGQCWFFAIMDEKLWARMLEHSIIIYKVGTDWPIDGDYKRWEQLANKKYSTPKPRLPKREAGTRRCTDSISRNEHEMLDNCYQCAPYWDAYPVCPDCRTKLSKGKVIFTCPRCHKRFTWKEDSK